MSEDAVRTDSKMINVGTCPACTSYLWADVTTQTIAREPYWMPDGKPRANAVTDTVAMSLDHRCDSREDDA
jgi:hypothetical protein